MTSMKSTPWGIADYQKKLTEGVISVGTPSHGGILVSAEVLAKWPQELRDFEPFAGKGCFEEDCDWAVVCLAMPSLFKDVFMHDAAMQTLRHDMDPFIAAYLETERGKDFEATALAWRIVEAERGAYRTGGMGTTDAGWDVYWTPYDPKLPRLTTVHEGDYPPDLPNTATESELAEKYKVVHAA